MRGHHSIPYAIFLVIMISLAPGECAMAEEAKSPGRSVEERHELGLFLGGTHRGSENGFAAGLDYEYRISPLFGFGGLIEFTGGDIRDGVLGFPFFFHVWGGLKLVGAPGIEFATSGSDDFLVRLGGEYGFEIGRGFELAPALYVDVTEEDTALVYGVSFAKSF